MWRECLDDHLASEITEPAGRRRRRIDEQVAPVQRFAAFAVRENRIEVDVRQGRAFPIDALL
jgi:hypothetical protein